MAEKVIKHPANLPFRWYSKQAESTAQTTVKADDKALTYAVLGLNGEAGECAEEVKKAIREDRPVNRTALLHELGDILWYVNRASIVLGSSLEEVALLNATKLAMRNGLSIDLVEYKGGA